MSLCTICQRILSSNVLMSRMHIKNPYINWEKHLHLLRSPVLKIKTNSLKVSLSQKVSGSASWYSTLQDDVRKNGPRVHTTIDVEEVEKFTALSQLWWDEGGEFEALHTMNELRVPLIRDALMKKTDIPTAVPLKGCTILDVGSGGGILSEPLARLGASVTGVEASGENIKIAQAHVLHDPALADSITYMEATVEDLVGTEQFDAVVTSEVVEHVADAPAFLASCCKLLKPGGSLFITTLNKTYASYVFGVVAAERVLNLVSPGTHDWNKFLDPQDIQFILNQNGCSTRLVHGMMYNPLTKRWSWIENTSINYAIHAVRMDDDVDDKTQTSENNAETL